MLQQTNMSNTDYRVAVSLFSLAYALFEVPSNMIIKRYVHPSVWLAVLLGMWGVFTIGFAVSVLPCAARPHTDQYSSRASKATPKSPSSAS